MRLCKKASRCLDAQRGETDKRLRLPLLLPDRQPCPRPIATHCIRDHRDDDAMRAGVQCSLDEVVVGPREPDHWTDAPRRDTVNGGPQLRV